MKIKTSKSYYKYKRLQKQKNKIKIKGGAFLRNNCKEITQTVIKSNIKCANNHTISYG